jgi:PAS domain S-box-containing protein
MTSPLNILMLEDSETDTELIQRMLKKVNPLCNFRLAMNKKSFLEDLKSFKPDLVLADNSLNQFDAREALQIVNKRSLNIPFILVTGAVSEEFAADIIKLGADDYVLKDRLSKLPKAISDALKQRRIEKEKTDALQSLMKSEENLKAIFDSASEAFILTDTEGIIKDFNNRAKDTILHISEKIILKGQSIFYFIEDLRKEYFETIIGRILAGENIHYDKLYTSPLGKTHWINYSFSPVKKGTAITGICITGRDITSSKMADQQMEFDHNNLHALINNTHDLMWSVDRSFRLITSNHAFNELVMTMSGVKPVKGANILKDLFHIEKEFGFRGCYERAFSGEAFSEIVHTILTTEFWSEVSFYPIYEDDDVIGTACFSRNITERKKSEEEIRLSTERMEAILNTLPANIVLLDEKGFIVTVNDAWKKFVAQNGFSGQNFGINDNYLSVSEKATGLDEEDGKAVLSGIQGVLQNKIKEFVFEYKCNLPDIQRWFRMVATPLQEQEYSGAVVMHIDISELRRLEQERLKGILDEQKKITRLVLSAQEKERTRLGQELHDNISQLLAAIKMKLGFCLSHPEKSVSVIEECTDYLQEAMTEARNLSHKMVIPRFEESGFRLSLELLVQQYQNDHKVIRLELSRMDENAVSAEIKETLYRIVQEQLNNIEKYAQATEVVVQILTYPDHVAFVIRDNGVGFDLDEKADGIGLTNIYNRVESFNGTSKIITEPGQGCTLLVEIPIDVKE